MLQTLWEKETLLWYPAWTLSNTLGFDTKTQFDFVNLPKKTAVIALDAMGKWNPFTNILSFFQYPKRQLKYSIGFRKILLQNGRKLL